MAIVLIIILIVVFNWKTLFPKKTTTQIVPPLAQRAKGAAAKTLTLHSDGFPLKKGSIGPRVVDIQHTLNAANIATNAKLNEDGIWGSKTDAEFRRQFLTTPAGEMSLDNYNKYVQPFLAQISDKWVGGSGNWDTPVTDETPTKTSMFDTGKI